MKNPRCPECDFVQFKGSLAPHEKHKKSCSRYTGKLENWDCGDWGTEPTMEDFDHDKNALEPIEAHVLLMELYLELENQDIPYSPFCSHGEYGDLFKDCPICKIWDRIREYAKNNEKEKEGKNGNHNQI